jgi:hypothetical protein
MNATVNATNIAFVQSLYAAFGAVTLPRSLPALPRTWTGP